MIRLLVGPPGAGKSTYIREHSKEGDLVVELERFYDLTGDETLARHLRGAVEASAKDFGGGDVWIARTLASAEDIEAFTARVGVDDVLVLDPGAEAAKERVLARDGDEGLFGAIDRWYAARPDSVNVSDIDDKESPVSAQDKHDEPVQSEEQEAAEGGNPVEGEGGYPADTPLKDMTSEQLVAYWKEQSRKHEGRAKALSKELAAGKEPEPAPEPAPAVDRRLFDAEFKASARRHPGQNLEQVAGFLDVSKFASESGDLDTQAIDDFVDSLVARPASGAPADAGKRGGYDGGSGLSSGAALFEQMKKN